MKRIIPAALGALLIVALPVFAGEMGENPQNPRTAGNTDGDSKRDFSFTNIFKDKLPIPSEQSFTPPDLATLGNWSPIRNNYAWGTEKFLVSQDSLSVGDKDRIVRYAVAIPLRDGKTYNYVYEGMDCDTAQYHTYLYGNSNNMAWAPINRPWLQVAEQGYNTYQAPIYSMFCSLRDPVSIKEMKNELGDTTLVNPGRGSGGVK